MIIVTNPEKPLELTAKGSVRRNICIAKYETEIEELYRAVEESSQIGIKPPAEWTPESMLDFVQTIVHKVMGQPVGETDDLFQNGCDR